MPYLTTEQIEEVKTDIFDHQGEQHRPVRFLCGGQCIDPFTGHLLPKGINVMYQYVYWHMPKETAKKIAKVDSSTNGPKKTVLIWFI